MHPPLRTVGKKWLMRIWVPRNQSGSPRNGEEGGGQDHKRLALRVTSRVRWGSNLWSRRFQILTEYLQCPLGSRDPNITNHPPACQRGGVQRLSCLNTNLGLYLRDGSRFLAHSFFSFYHDLLWYEIAQWLLWSLLAVKIERHKKYIQTNCLFYDTLYKVINYVVKNFVMYVPVSYTNVTYVLSFYINVIYNLFLHIILLHRNFNTNKLYDI